MIKIEFKEVVNSFDDDGQVDYKFEFIKKSILSFMRHYVTDLAYWYKSITSYIPTQDPYLDRSFILQQLGISKEQDNINQELWKTL